jgi:hypothetical protein
MLAIGGSIEDIYGIMSDYSVELGMVDINAMDLHGVQTWTLTFHKLLWITH